MRVSIIRKAHFNACHRLHVSEWSDDKNKEIFGLCNSTNYHGHNYDLQVKLTGEVNPVTGYLMDLKDLKDIIKEEIEKRFDHKNLNLDTEEFKSLNPTTENFAYIIHGLLRKKIDPAIDIKIYLWETPRNGVEYPAD
jgi:6-pyruvoyltetrahydropterin/6-carboxytetrahydropterin synthase